MEFDLVVFSPGRVNNLANLRNFSAPPQFPGRFGVCLDPQEILLHYQQDLVHPRGQCHVAELLVDQEDCGTSVRGHQACAGPYAARMVPAAQCCLCSSGVDSRGILVCICCVWGVLATLWKVRFAQKLYHQSHDAQKGRDGWQPKLALQPESSKNNMEDPAGFQCVAVPNTSKAA